MQDDDALDAEASSTTSPWSTPEPNAPKQPAGTGRFGSAAERLDADAPPRRVAVPASTQAAAARLAAKAAAQAPTEAEKPARRPLPLFVLASIAAVLVLGVVGAFVLLGGDADNNATGPSTSDPNAVTTPPTSDANATLTSNVSAGPSTLPTVPPPPPDATVPLSPGRVVVEQEIIDFRGEETSQRLRLTNSGGGEANWSVGVGSGSGLRLPITDGRIRPGEVVEVEIVLDRAAGPPVSDWSERLLVLGGGIGSPSRVLVRVFPV